MTASADLRLVRARHDAVNTLVRYLRPVDDHDLDGVLTHLRHAVVSFGGPPHRGVPDLTDAYRAAFAAGGRTRHLLHEAEVAWSTDGQQILGRAAYQRWSLEAATPELTAIGQYHAVFDPDDEQLQLAELSVHRDWQRP